MTVSNNPVVVSLQDLKSGLMDDTLDRAFGPDSLGIILVKDLPQEFHELRQKVLCAAGKVANYKDKTSLEAPDANYLIGWSCGVERLASGNPDVHKGSFYINCGVPVVSSDFTDLGYGLPNLWPDIPSFKDDFDNLFRCISMVTELVAKACDRYIAKQVPGYPSRFVEDLVKNSNTTKARLLHYFPLSEKEVLQNAADNDSWCGEHLDHDCLTALTSAMFRPSPDDFLNPANEIDNPEPESGLFIKSRTGELVKVSIPRDMLAFQSGEAIQEITKGRFKAVPHLVRAPTQTANVSRSTIAFFFEPDLQTRVNDKEDFAAFSRRIVAQTTPKANP
ncbi:hypothetical protein CANCADRAFT_147875 [Tortispora caseinolytica NRRL Y-17796]|uniref:Isopenicillin N synthase-like Fe(2+) 2OG dioxygenase domain-containing protein n=1 Tax=Tortispora caseinolytica NRRL Y-17796 TaxID=767744 RepID=A0A1E4TEI0_9ASCO|nr:hypothetical protein CANCADRAFT_147875 [Tortispora caseinolytica NRRL Y-17796]